MMENLKMKTLAKLALAKPGVAALLAGAVAIPVLNANAVEHTANFTLQTKAAGLTLTHERNTDFGTITIPTGRNTLVRLPKTNGVMTISNATVGTTYTLTLTIGRDPCSNRVALSPSVTYEDRQIVGATDITYVADTTTLSMSGLLFVDETTTAGVGTCIYDVTIATAASGG